MDKNKNENCLEGMQCPQCGQAKRVLITAISTFTMTDDGSEEHDSVEYGDGENARCPDCGCTTNVGGFREAYDMVHNPPEPSSLEDDNKKLRELLAMSYSGFRHLYTDDGCLTDSRAPMIDYYKDTVAQIEHAIKTRGVSMLSGSDRAADFVKPEDT